MINDLKKDGKYMGFGFSKHQFLYKRMYEDEYRISPYFKGIQEFMDSVKHENINSGSICVWDPKAELTDWPRAIQIIKPSNWNDSKSDAKKGK